jgi:hypothetical protein
MIKFIACTFSKYDVRAVGEDRDFPNLPVKPAGVCLFRRRTD